MTEDRIIHGAVGAAFWFGYVIIGKSDDEFVKKIAMLPIVFLGTWVPDWDLIFGIGYHRSPLTHSILPFLISGRLAKPVSGYVFPVGFALGLASHLFWDIVWYGNVHHIPGKTYDRLFLGANMLVLLIWVVILDKNYRFSNGISSKR